MSKKEKEMQKDLYVKMFMVGLGGIVIGIIFALIFWPERIATLSDGTQIVATVSGQTITSDSLYNEMKKYYKVSILLDQIDRVILDKKYPVTEEITSSAKEQADYYIKSYQTSYGIDEATFLANNGFDSYEDFITQLQLDIQRNNYYQEYLEEQITDKQIDTYYKNNVYGDINTQHLLVKFDDYEEDKALEIANTIIKKLKSGKTWEEVKKTYESKTTFEDLGYVSFDENYEEAFMEELESLGTNKYSTTPVKTSYGYHIIYRLDQKEKPSLKDSKTSVIEALKAQLEEKDENIYYKALIALRKDAKLEISDTTFSKMYKEYKKEYK